MLKVQVCWCVVVSGVHVVLTGVVGILFRVSVFGGNNEVGFALTPLKSSVVNCEVRASQGEHCWESMLPPSGAVMYYLGLL